MLVPVAPVITTAAAGEASKSTLVDTENDVAAYVPAAGLVMPAIDSVALVEACLLYTSR